MALLLMMAGAANEARAAKVTYHVLTLPIDASEAHMVSAVDGKRLEAVRAIVDNATTIELPAHFKSPLATNFKYYAASEVEASAATELHSGSNRVKGIIYNLKAGAVETAEGATVDANMDIYVTYDYVGNSNAIAKLDGTGIYNIGVKKGFLALNRGRNNRPAVVPKSMVSDAQMISEDFVKVDVSGSGITTYWSSGDNKNPQASVGSQFHFLFKLEGNDPYNIIIRTAYNNNDTYIEKEGTGEQVYKWYKNSSIFAPSTNNTYLASDEHHKFQRRWVSGSANPTATDLDNSTDYESRPGFFHGQAAPIWSTFALLNNTTGDGYVFMGSRTYNNDGSFSNPGGSNNNYQYKYLKFDAGNLTINNLTPAQATTNYSTDQKFYEVKTVTFKVKTPFYDKDGTDEEKAAHTVSASVKMSEYKILNDDIAMSDIPTSLERKYCTFTKFYDDAAHTCEITKYSEMTGYDIYVAYEVSASLPFAAITPSSYDANTWKAATWYELTDDGSTEESGKKLKYDGTSSFKNNGAHNEFAKASEYAFIGDPYELQVVLRSETSDATPSYVGAASEGNLGISTTGGDGYHWEMPDDETAGSFLLRRFGGGGYWNWETGNISQDIAYTTKAHTCNVTYSNTQTLTFNISGLTVADGNYIKVTAGGTDAAQITATTPALSSGIGGVASDGTATVTATIAANSSGATKTFTLTIQEYNSSNAAVGAPSVITINQGTTAYAGSTVEYSTTASTRVKAMELSNAKYTYKIVDKSGRIAVTATTTQPIYSPLSIATIPSIIVSPFIVDEKVTFYSTYTGGGRANLNDEITEAPEPLDPETGATIYVKYTTTKLDEKPFNLSEDQEIFVRLNGQYIYYDAEDGTLKSTENSGAGDEYKWKLRNLDPYAMLLDNLGARTALGATGSETITVPTDDDGTTASESRQVGAWVKLATTVGNDAALAFDKDRANAQPFIAKSSARAGVYEVMVATGDGVDASTTYYHIGRPDENTVKIYSNATYQAGDDDEIKFRLEENTTYTYHLIDKSKHELLTVTSKSPELVLPAEYQSPLVGAANYSYYDVGQFNIAEDVYTLKSSPVKLTNISSLLATYTKSASDATAYTNAGSSLEASTEADMESEVKKLTVTGHYYYKVGDGYFDMEVTKPCYTDIYVTYEKNDLVTFNDNGSPYLLRFLQPFAEGYYLENGGDRLTTEKLQAIYPYTNGDGSLFIYGERMNEEQMGGGASTRPRWIWYFTNPSGYADDPYHVTIHSRSTISYNGVGHPTYLKTEAINFNQDAEGAAKHIITRGALPGITSELPTEYMVLGTQGNYRLMTTNEIEGARRSVTSLEQYWKTYNIVKLDVLGISTSTNAYSEDPATWVVPTEDDPETTDVDESTYRTTLAARDWHSYEVYANATRWNGYNNVSTSNAGSKVVEKLEHWFQTFDMGNGSFVIEDANIPPVLVLLDRHGWEVMRKPLPTTTYPNGDELDALRVYDSPMVKEYHFFSNASKASGCHKYYLREQNGALRDEIKVNGSAYTSTSLGTLPPITASGVKDGYGFIQDFYVTYTVKEEYEKSYDYSFTDNGNGTFTETGTPSKFIVAQNGRFLKKENDTKPNYISKPIWEHTNPTGGNAYDLILSPQNNTVTIKNGDKIADYNFWYIGPNLDIDREMGINWGTATSGAEPLTEAATKALYYDPEGTKIAYTQSTGFDPYNLQIKNADDGRCITSHMTSAALVEGAMVGDYDTDEGGSLDITLTAPFSWAEVDPAVSTGSEGYDHTNLKIGNQTFMAVSDANGNMQLMPRFDHTKRINTSKASPYYTTLEDPLDNPQKATVEDNNSMNAQTTFFVRPQIFEYLIIDNEGREALRYKRSGDYYPAITEHFKSPLATDFTFYKTAPSYNAETKKLTVSDEITGSFAEADLKGDNVTVYVRYDYNENYDRDNDNILQGKWFTINLAGKDVQSSGTINTSDGTGVSLYADAVSPATPTKPSTVNEDDKIWQWKFLAAPTDPSSDYYIAPDPYAIELYNRNANYATTLAEPSPMSIPIKVNGKDRFSLLSHPEGGYALAVNGLGTYTYSFLNGATMTTPTVGEGESVAATTAPEANFTAKNNVITSGAQLTVNDDVDHNYTYNVINNAGTFAVSSTQTKAEAAANAYAPYLPEASQTPLLNEETDYTYYGSVTISGDIYTMVDATKLFTLYGLYDDVVYVRYNDYNAETTPYLVPNKRNDTGSTIARAEGSNDVAMNISGELPYNIIWETDNIMQSSDGNTISDGGAHGLDGNNQYVWYFIGGDPYDLKIKHKDGKYVDGTSTLQEEAGAKSFMLLKKSGYDYGILQETGGTKKLTGFGGALTADASTDPAKFIIFGLSVHDLIYHLIIANTCADKTNPQSGEYVDIPFMESESGTQTAKRIYGTTQRDLTSKKDDDAANPVGSKCQLGSTLAYGGNTYTYCYDAGAVSIGDELEVPGVFYRPNCTFEYYVEGVYNQDGTSAETALNNKYKGLKRDILMPDAELIGKTVVVNIVYQFNTELATNSGLGFVTSVDQNLWYTMETTESGTPHLVRYTSTEGLKSAAGRETHYTNDFLWTPLGDVYGFYMYNRYATRNMEVSTVMTTSNLNIGTSVTMGDKNANAIYELLAGEEEGTFRYHPVANNTGTRVFVTADGTDLKLSSLSPTEWTYGLDLALMQPYYLGAGNVGGLTLTPNDGQEKSGKELYEEALATGKVIEIQSVVYDDNNIVHFTPGYYRLHSQPGISGISPVRYASGYLHDIEKTAGDGGTPIPMHFYSKQGVLTSFGDDGLRNGYTETAATRGDIPIAPTESDPSTVFYVTGSQTNNTAISEVTMSTQGLNVIGNTMGTGSATEYRLIDIGGGVVILVNTTDNNYFSFNQGTNIYDLKYSASSTTRLDDVKWCMEPANTLGLEITMNDGGDGYYYATFYAPFDVLLPADDGDKKYYAYVCTEWNTTNIHPAKVEAHSPYAAGKFVPAGTPVIFRTTDTSGSMSLTLPTTAPSSPLSCVFSGQYLEQMLDADVSHDVYTFGLPFTSTVTINREDGSITSPAIEQAETGIGFYINATPNKEADASQSLWQRNNRYVLHNKIYYRATSGARERHQTHGVEFVPVIFDDGEETDDDQDRRSSTGDNRIYDLKGCCVATEQMVADGSWRERLTPGVYILNGRKIMKR